MQTITFPLRIEMQGDEVSHLHQALEKLGLRINRRERAEKWFGRTTYKAVSLFQKKYRLDPTVEGGQIK